MALMLVTAAVAMATVLGYAVLENTATNARLSETATLIPQADALAESGVNFAVYNLMHPLYAPAYSGNFWPGTTSPVSLGSDIPGTFSVVVTDPSNASTGPYTIVSNASVPGEDGSPVIRQVTAVVSVTSGFSLSNQAAGFNGSLSLGSNVTVNGDLHASGTVTLGAGAIVNGAVDAQSLVLNGGNSPSSFVQLSTNNSQSAPTTHTDYTLPYVLGGVSYTPGYLVTDPVAGTVLGPTATNPAGIYYTNGRAVNLNGVTINGTLIVKGGGLTVKGSAANTITPASGYPGLVVDNAVTMNSTNRTLTVNGLLYAGQGITGSGTSNSGSVLTVNGSLLVPGSTTISSLYTGKLTLNYNQQNASVPAFSTQMQVPTNIRVQSWTP